MALSITSFIMSRKPSRPFLSAWAEVSMAQPKPSTNASTSAEVTPIRGGTSTEKNGAGLPDAAVSAAM